MRQKVAGDKSEGVREKGREKVYKRVGNEKEGETVR
jgi:hypothetical protein